VARHLGIFDGVFATDDRNLTGEAKVLALQAAFGFKGFAYAGNSAADLPCWRAASEALLVNAPAGVLSQALKQGVDVTHTLPPAGRVGLLLRAVRPHQWAKNLLLFTPLLAARQFANWYALAAAALGAVAISLIASAVYLVNDILDLDADRCHPSKRRRPFASGQLSVAWGVALAPALAAAGLALASRLGTSFSALALLYLAVSFAYSLYFKKQLLQDVLVLAGLYTLRIFAGGLASSITVSTWFLAFAMFLFLSLAFLKRYADLAANTPGQGRGYQAVDAPLIAIFGGASALLASLVIVLYVSSPQVMKLYAKPELLWLACPLLIYWMARAWILAGRGKMSHDPVLFALADPASYLVGGLVVVLGWLAA
jgi:4-hydroxybenzoate polyprenyltransferase